MANRAPAAAPIMMMISSYGHGSILLAPFEQPYLLRSQENGPLSTMMMVKKMATAKKLKYHHDPIEKDIDQVYSHFCVSRVSEFQLVRKCTIYKLLYPSYSSHGRKRNIREPRAIFRFYHCLFARLHLLFRLPPGSNLPSASSPGYYYYNSKFVSTAFVASLSKSIGHRAN